MDKGSDRLILTLRGALFVSYLDDGHNATEAERLTQEALARNEDKSRRTGTPRPFGTPKP
jgi:hypothetical protein